MDTKVHKLILVAAVTCLVGCKAGVPKITENFPSDFRLQKSPTTFNFASSAGTAVSGTTKVKFTLGGNLAQDQVALTSTSSGTIKIKATSAGVTREQ